MLFAWVLVAVIGVAALVPVVLLLRRGERLPVAVMAAAIALAVFLPAGVILAFFAGTDRESADGPLPLLAAMLYLSLPLALLCAAFSWRMWLGLRNGHDSRQRATRTRSRA